MTPSPRPAENIVALFPMGSYTMEWIRASDLKIDHRYQRDPNPALQAKIALEFDPDKFHALLVSARTNGDRVVLDGQQRLGAIGKMNWMDQKLPTLILRNLTPQREAEIFRDIQVNRRAVSQLALWKADLFSGDQACVEIKRVMDGLGLHFITQNQRGSKNNDPTELQAVKCVRDMHEHLGAIGLHRLLRVIKLAFHDHMAWNANMIRGMALYLASYPELNDDKVIKKLGKFTAEHVLRKASQMKGGGGESTGSYAAFFLLDAYNHATHLQKDKLTPKTPTELGAALRGLRGGFRLGNGS
jgi:hypothetical protein